jgi:hypothetical protein
VSVVSYMIPPEAVATVRTWAGASVNERTLNDYNGWAFAILRAAQIDKARALGAIRYDGVPTDKAFALAKALREADLRAEVVAGDLEYGVNVWPPFRHGDRFPHTTVWWDQANYGWIWGDDFEFGCLDVSPAVVAHNVMKTMREEG